MSKEAMKLALEALENLLEQYYCNTVAGTDCDQAHEAITAIKQALAAPVQEPVASTAYDMIDRFLRNNLSSDADYAEYSVALDALYTTPPAAQRQWVGLTEDEQDDLVYNVFDSRTRMELAIGIEAKLKEKNT